MKPGDVVRFNPPVSYHEDWLQSKFLVAPGSVGHVVPTGNYSGVHIAAGPKRIKTYKPSSTDPWIPVNFPPDVQVWYLLAEDLEVVYEAETPSL